MKKYYLMLLAILCVNCSAQTLLRQAGFNVRKTTPDLLTVTYGKTAIKIDLTGGFLDLGQPEGYIFKDAVANKDNQLVANSDQIKYSYREAKIKDGKLLIKIAGNLPAKEYANILISKQLEFSPNLQSVISVITFSGEVKGKRVKIDPKLALSVLSENEFKTAPYFEFSGEKPLDLAGKKDLKVDFVPAGTQYVTVNKKYNLGLKGGEMEQQTLSGHNSARVVIKSKPFISRGGVRLFWGRYVPEKPTPVYKDFTLEKFYDLKGKIASRASLHLHCMFHPTYTHAPIKPADRLKEYRDAKVTPRYGFAVISEHNRIIIPETCEPVGAQPQWGVEGIVFVPGMERMTGNYLGSYHHDRMLGEINVIGVSREKIEPFVGSQLAPANQRRLKHNRWPVMASELTISEMIDEGLFISLCHPECRHPKGIHHWKTSGYNWDEMDVIFGNPNKGMPGFKTHPQALEIGNQGYDFSARTQFTNAEGKWDFYLTRGHRIKGTASDDAHYKAPLAGWVVVYVDKLDQESLLKALKSGNYYSSQGPEIKNIAVEDKTLTVESVKPAKIEFIGAYGKVLATFNNVTKASYTAEGNEVYVRARVTHNCPEMGNIKAKNIRRIRSAWTNPLFLQKK